MSYTDVLDLYASCDVFVSLHRAEGLGLGPMEAMAMGKAVIATGWSGNMTYMNHSNACPVGYRLIPVEGSIVDYSSQAFRKEAMWADPDVQQAAAWMRRLMDDPALRAAIGERARDDLARHHARAREGAFIDELRAIWDHQMHLTSTVAGTRQGARQDVVRQRSDRLSNYLLWHAEQATNNAYQAWVEGRARHKQELAEPAAPAMAGPVFHVIVRLPARADARLADSIDTILQQDYPGYCLTILADTPEPQGFEQNELLHWFIAGSNPLETLNEIVARIAADWVLCIDAGDQLAPNLLSSCAASLRDRPDWLFIYTDEDIHDGNGKRTDPSFKPDCNLDLLRSTPYVGNACVVRREAWVEVGGCAPFEGVLHYDIALKILSRYGEKTLGHVAEVIFHRFALNARRLDAMQLHENSKTVLRQHFERVGCDVVIEDGLTANSFYVDYRHADMPHVTIMVPTRDRLDVWRHVWTVC